MNTQALEFLAFVAEHPTTDECGLPPRSRAPEFDWIPNKRQALMLARSWLGIKVYGSSIWVDANRFTRCRFWLKEATGQPLGLPDYGGKKVLHKTQDPDPILAAIVGLEVRNSRVTTAASALLDTVGHVDEEPAPLTLPAAVARLQMAVQRHGLDSIVVDAHGAKSRKWIRKLEEVEL